MSLISKNGLIQRIRRGREIRSALVRSNLAKGIAFQIRATRDRQKLTQEQLAKEAGMTQNTVSRLENPDYGKHSVTSLQRIADALDVALVVRFIPFSQYVDWLSGTPYEEKGLDSESLAVPSFSKEEENRAFDRYEPLAEKTQPGAKAAAKFLSAFSGSSGEANRGLMGGSILQPLPEQKGYELCS